MTETINPDVVTDKVKLVRRMIRRMRSMPLSCYEDFTADSINNIAVGETCLRRAMEALCDIGQYILAKGYAKTPQEYRDIASDLVTVGIISEGDGPKLTEMVRYPNRIVHPYNEISQEELYRILCDDPADLERFCDAMVTCLDGLDGARPS